MNALLLTTLIAFSADQGISVFDKPAGEDSFQAKGQFRIDPGGAPTPHGATLRFALTHPKPILLSIKARKLKKGPDGEFKDDGPAAMVLVKLEDAADKPAMSAVLQSGGAEWDIGTRGAAMSQWRPKLPPTVFGWTPWKLTISTPPLTSDTVQVDFDLRCGGASLSLAESTKTLPSGKGGDLRFAFPMRFEGTYLVRAWAEGSAGREAGKIQPSRLVLGPKGGAPAYDRTKTERHDFSVSIGPPAIGIGKTGSAVLTSSSAVRPLRLRTEVRLQPRDRSLGLTKF